MSTSRDIEAVIVRQRLLEFVDAGYWREGNVTSISRA